MRKLVILRGAMGCGKSTFVKENNLDEFTLSSDKIRLMFNAPQMNVEYTEVIPQFNNKMVWELLYSVLEERMKKGEFTVVDAVHGNSKESFPVYKKLAEKYRYRLYVLDFTDVPKEEVYKRNRGREKYKIVPEYVIDKAYKMFAKEKLPSSFKICKPEDFDRIIDSYPRNFDKYQRIHIIGDVHGCFTALSDYFDKYPINNEDAYIFLGDYFDRGLENSEMFSFLESLMEYDNMFFLLGNHEDKLYKYACDDDFKMDYALEKTIEGFENEGIDKSRIRGFIKRLAQISFIEYGKKKYLIDHGGISYMPAKSLDFYSTDSFVYGVGDYETDIDRLYDGFMKECENKVYQIHGHRNFYKHKFDEYEYSYNLDGDVEHGGHLRVMTIAKDGCIDCVEIENGVFDSQLDEKTNVYNLTRDLFKNKYVFARNLGDSIYSFNFSKEAFYNGVWNRMTTQARGLFVDTENNRIIARSYNKFFKVDERPETRVEKLADSFSYPIDFYLKYNGFLGILSLVNGEFFFASKSTNTGNYVEYFKNILLEKYNTDQLDALKNVMVEEDVTVVFEVIDPLNDPHIIEYEESTIILLDMIRNSTMYSKLPYSRLENFAIANGFVIKRHVYTANNKDEFERLYKEVTSEDYTLDGKYVEGFVVEDDDGLMVKTKTFYYDRWKALRFKMENALKTKNFDVKCKTEFECSFMKYLQNKYENSEVDYRDLNIIDERNEFLK